MAAFDTTTSTYGSTGFVGRILAPVTKLFALIISWNDTRQTRNSLSRLTDRELDDIGLSRGDIEGVAHGHIVR
ncbi:MAG: DUF1127 domain-containing protein [Pseudomonadota bacterium]